jgi:ABC-type bacteriocin/lantibiotic exporter with double-glycine peptidase domain
MRNHLFKFYDWCDKQKDILEFFIFAIPMLILIMGFHGTNITFSIFCIIALLFIVISRIIHLFENKIKKIINRKKKNDKH